MPQETTQYKFLIEKQIQKIKGGDQQTKQDHKEAKQQMKGLLEYAKGLKSQVMTTDGPDSQQPNSLKKLITVDFDRVNAEKKSGIARYQQN